MQDNGRAVIRKDLHDKFLAERNFRLIWIFNAEKEIHILDTLLNSQYSEWTSVLSYDGRDINDMLWRIEIIKPMHRVCNVNLTLMSITNLI